MAPTGRKYWFPGQGGQLPRPLLTLWWRQRENKSELHGLLGLRKKQVQSVCYRAGRRPARSSQLP